MRFRLTDGFTWAHEFPADDAPALSAGLALACARWLGRQRHPSKLPVQVHVWEAQRGAWLLVQPELDGVPQYGFNPCYPPESARAAAYWRSAVITAQHAVELRAIPIALTAALSAAWGVTPPALPN